MQYIFKVEWQQQFKSSGICTNHKFFVHFRDIATTCKKMSSGQTLGVKAQRFRGHTSPHRNVKEKKICHQKYYFTQNLRVLWKFNNSHVLTFEMLLQNATKYNLRELSLQYQYIYQNFNTLYTQMFTLNIITTGIVQPTMYCCQHLANEISRKCATQFWQILCKCQNSQLLQDFTKQNHATIIKITFNYSVLYSTMLINNKTCIHTYPFYLQQNSEIFNQVIRNNKVQVSTNLLYAHHSCSHQLATMYVLLQKIFLSSFGNTPTTSAFHCSLFFSSQPRQGLMFSQTRSAACGTSCCCIHATPKAQQPVELSTCSVTKLILNLLH
eukprot:TRINITY_DN1957_c0_g2_i8.p1 TRINITY_DN1957_c0_g2~~TRINITY_DN1957_c0_g2_i8.p1  ORF type:complete len:325 (-),score=-2.27 TRINITY_DN1957_c0_g2_i8:150-1124(-)